jgi:hypothetical protein
VFLILPPPISGFMDGDAHPWIILEHRRAEAYNDLALQSLIRVVKAGKEDTADGVHSSNYKFPLMAQVLELEYTELLQSIIQSYFVSVRQ